MLSTYDTHHLRHEPSIRFSNSHQRHKAHARMLRLRPGQMLFHQGDGARTVFRVVSGVLRLRRVTEAGQQQVISFGYPGDIVGFPKDGERTTECDALTAAHLEVIPAGSLDAAERPEEVAFLARAALAEIDSIQQHLMTLGRTTSLEKVAAFLALLMDRAGRPTEDGMAFDLPMSRADIAEFLGLRTETVSRAFTELRKAGVIALETAQSVVVRNPMGLAQTAEAA